MKRNKIQKIQGKGKGKIVKERKIPMFRVQPFYNQSSHSHPGRGQHHQSVKKCTYKLNENKQQCA